MFFGVMGLLCEEGEGIGGLLCSATTLKMKPRESTRTTTGSTFRPGDSSV